jgi:hypothetical protein
MYKMVLECPENKVRNPTTKRCVLRSGKIGMSITSEKKKSSRKTSYKKDMTVADIKAELKKRCIKGYSGKKKDELLRMLEMNSSTKKPKSSTKKPKSSTKKPKSSSTKNTK